MVACRRIDVRSGAHVLARCASASARARESACAIPLLHRLRDRRHHGDRSADGDRSLLCGSGRRPVRIAQSLSDPGRGPGPGHDPGRTGHADARADPNVDTDAVVAFTRPRTARAGACAAIDGLTVTARSHDTRGRSPSGDAVARNCRERSDPAGHGPDPARAPSSQRRPDGTLVQTSSQTPLRISAVSAKNRASARRGDFLKRRDTGYWMTPVACCRRDGGTVSPNAWAVLRLITKSNFMGCSIGRSAGSAL